MRALYNELCEENGAVPGSLEANYLWREYIADIATLDILRDVEETGVINAGNT